MACTFCWGPGAPLTAAAKAIIRTGSVRSSAGLGVSGMGCFAKFPVLVRIRKGVRQSSNRGSNRYGSGSWMVTAANSGCSGLRIMLVSAGATADGTISPTL